MRLWSAYKNIIRKRNSTTVSLGVKDLIYWRDHVFTYFLIYAVPVCLVALIPGIFMAVKTNNPARALVDLSAAGLLLWIALNKSVSLPVKKGIIILTIFGLGVALMNLLGISGPGILYLLASTILCNMIFPSKIAYGSIALNSVTCGIFALLWHLDSFNTQAVSTYNLTTWISYFFNFLFISIVITVLIQVVFFGLQATIIKEGLLQKELASKKNKLEALVKALNLKNEDLEQFAYIASHDLQEPLRTATALVNNLQHELKNCEEEDTVLQFNYLSQTLLRMQSLITGLLEYSRIGRDKVRQKVDCNILISELLLDLQAAIEANKARIIYENLPEIEAYKLELRQLFQNLLTNALKFQDQGNLPVIKISAQKQDNNWLFWVMDNGIGIEEKCREKIFAIFQRLHPKSKFEGSGIGLAHCHKIVQLHHGKIWVEANPAGGSIFMFSLPQN